MIEGFRFVWLTQFGSLDPNNTGLLNQERVSEIIKEYELQCRVRVSVGPSEWRSGLRHCNTVLAVPLEILGLSPGSVVAGRDRETNGAVRNWPSVVWVRGGFGRQGCPPTPVAGRAQCMLTWPSGLSGHCVKKQCGLVRL
jgi:hypothetical protein